MENKEFEQVYSENVIEFVTIANEFCSFLENIKNYTRTDILEKLQKILSKLYLKGSSLPALDSFYDDANEKFVSEMDWNYIQKNLENKLGEFDEFLEVFDPRMQDRVEPIVMTISENLADIYQDVKDFIMLYRVGNNEIMNDAIWECKNTFNDYWGQKCLNVLRAIHHLIYQEDIDEEEEKT